LSGNEIGVKLADGSFYPILEEDFTGRKKLVVTTARDNQESVQIDLFRGSGERADQASYIGSLMIENIHPAPKKEPEIELHLGVDPDGNLEAVASDPLSGEKQSLSVSLPSLTGVETAAAGDLDLEGESRARPAVRAEAFEQSLLAGESYPIGVADRRKEHLERRRPRVLAVIGFVLLGLIVLAGAAYLVYRLLDGERLPRLFGGASGQQSVQPEAGPPAAVEPAPVEPAAAEPAAQPAVQPRPAAQTAPAQPEGVWYRIRWGDTLWDLAGTYYRNPWLYPRLARANKIPNPDLIIAGRRLFIPKK